MFIFQSDTKIGDFRLVQSQDVVKIFYKSDVSFAVDTSANVKENHALRNPIFNKQSSLKTKPSKVIPASYTRMALFKNPEYPWRKYIKSNRRDV